MGADLDNAFSRGHVTLPIFVTSLESGGVCESECVEQADIKGTLELTPLESGTEDQANPQIAFDESPPRARVRQLQRPRKRPRRCDVCEKDFKSIGKMQAHRYAYEGGP